MLMILALNVGPAMNMCHNVYFPPMFSCSCVCVDRWLYVRPSHKVTKSMLRFYSNLLIGGILVGFQGPGVHQTYGKTAAAVRKIS